MTCGATWTTPELCDRDMSPLNRLPALPVRWPLCPECLSPLTRIGEAQLWSCGRASLSVTATKDETA